ncbi:MAG TPA: cell division protein ZipA C-terminal FtsZ-binding domain-containing protein [Steroidobacteraceae bacterium]|jgi:cell division protein ZipA
MSTAELRWILLIVCLVLYGALVWWERRRPRQASGGTERGSVPRELNAETTLHSRTEPALTLPTMRARDPLPPHELPIVEADLAGGQAAAAHSQAARAPPADELATLSSAAPPAVEPVVEETFEYVPQGAGTGTAPVNRPAPPREALPELPTTAAPQVEWPPDEQRQIVAVRLIAPMPERFAGRSLRQALAAEGFVLGRFAIFHKPDESHRAVLSAASLTRPGTFDADTMDSQHYGGLSLFAVLPGPKAPPQAFDELVFTARSLNERLQGVLQDEQGSPLTPSRIALLRERLSSGATL